MLKFTLRLIALLALVVTSCSEDPTTDNGGNVGNEGNGPAEGQITLYLSDKGFSNADWESGESLTINRKTYYVEKSNGKAVVYVDSSDNGTYEAFYPTMLYDRADKTFTLPFAQFYREGTIGENSLPMYGICKEGNKLDMKAVCALLQLTVAGTEEVMSVYVEDLSNGAIAGEYKFSTSTQQLSTPKDSAPSSNWLTLNCAGKESGGAQLSTAGTQFNIVIPAGSYSSGIKVRISDRKRKMVEKIFSVSKEVKAGEVLDLGVLNYAPDENLLYAQHFDNCTWGGDIVAGKKGLGRGNTATDIPSSTATGLETAICVKDSTTPGAAHVTTSDYINYSYNSSGLAVAKAYMRNRGLDDWRLLYMAQEYRAIFAVATLQDTRIVESSAFRSFRRWEIRLVLPKYRSASASRAAIRDIFSCREFRIRMATR